MKSKLLVLTLSAWMLSTAQTRSPIDFSKPLDLSRPHLRQSQTFIMQTVITPIGPDGTHQPADVYELHIMYDASAEPSGPGEVYRCLGLAMTHGEDSTVTVPALVNWTYTVPPQGYDEKGQVLGIDHAKFDSIKDSRGRLLPMDKAYHVYNAFVDFHSLCNVFAEPSDQGNGIQDLHFPGDEVLHYAAHSKPPTNVGSHVAEGSYFQNGEIKLSLKGVTQEQGETCALLGYDSGNSRFKMIIHPMPDMEVVAVGYSHYWGDIVKSLLSRWILRADLKEIVVAESTLPVPPHKMNQVVERHLVIKNITAAK